MNRMKKMLSLLLALAMVLTVMAGCQKQPQPVKDKSELAKEAVENYMEALMLFDFKEASTYTTNPEKMMESAPYDDLDDATNSILEAVPQDFAAYEDSILTYADAMFRTMQEAMSYEIIGIEEDGDDYVATIELTTINTNGADVMTQMMEDVNIEELLLQLLEDGTINENMTEQELMDILIPAMFEKMADVVKNVPLETTTTEETISIIEVDGKWLIDAATL